METLINVSLPIFVIMAMGYGAGHWKLLGEDAALSLNRFVLLFALPPAMFVFTARADIDDILNGPFITAFLLGSLATAIVALLVARYIFHLNLQETTLHGFLSVFTNSGYMGIPLFMAAFGPDNILPAIIITTVGPMMFIAVVMFAMELMRAPDKPLLGRLLVVALTLMKSPMLMASVLGAVFSWYAIPLPVSIGRVLDLLASSSGPVALFALGLSLIGHTLLGDLAEIFWISILKVIMQPLLTFLCVTYVFYMEPFWAQSAVILAALPIGSTAFVVAQQYDVAVRRASATVALSSVISIFTLSALLIYYEV